MLSDGTIRRLLRTKHLVIDPAPLNQAFQPASVDLSLDDTFLVMDTHLISHIDPREPAAYTRRVQTPEFYLHPGEFVLASTYERVEIPADLICQVNGKSSLGRRGLLIHATAGFVDPGFKGKITLELSNVSTLPILLTVHMLIAQVTFMYLDKPAERPYGTVGLGSKYQNQDSVQSAKEQ